MKPLITAKDLIGTIDYLIQKDATDVGISATFSAKEVDRVQRHATFLINSKTSNTEAFALYQSLINPTVLENSKTIFILIAEFLIWLGTSYVSTGKLKIPLFSYPKVISRVVKLVFDIIGVVKKVKPEEDAVLPTK